MTLRRNPLAGMAALLLTATLALAAASEPALSGRGRQIFSDDFDGSALAAGWVGKIGAWEVAHGAARGAERADDHHAAVCRQPLVYHDAIFEFSFRMDGAKMVHLSLNNKEGHVCRVIVSPQGMVLQADKPNPNSDLKAEKLGTLDTPVEAGKWHKLVVEVRGPRMTAVLDGSHSVTGTSPRLDVDKIDFGFPVAGVSASFDYVKVFEISK